MMVGTSLSVIYIDPPKTGSQTMDRFFRNMGCKPVQYMQFGKMVDKHQRTIPDAYKDFKTLASVRNPYRRALSFYYYDVRRKYNFINLDMSTFKTYMEGIIEKNSDVPADTVDIARYRYFPQWKYLSTNRIDHIIHLESIRPDFEKAGIVLKGRATPRLNKGKYKKSWDDLKSPELIELVNIWAGDDFELYGYEKETP